jgi:putative transposase
MEEDIKMFCSWKGAEVIELNVQIDYIHLLVSVPSKVSISNMVGILKGKLAIRIFKSYPKLKNKPYWGNHFWARGYFVSTVGIDKAIKRYVKYQKEEGKKINAQQNALIIYCLTARQAFFSCRKKVKARPVLLRRSGYAKAMLEDKNY